MECLSAYIPMDRRRALARGDALPDRARGAVLFADVSGFTPLAQAFAAEMGPQRGAEALLEIINPVYEALIAPLHRYGGSVISFAGDAITCWLDVGDGPAEPRAVAAALAMQAAMRQFEAVRTPVGALVELGIKVAVAAGPARRFLVGDPAIQQKADAGPLRAKRWFCGRIRLAAQRTLACASPCTLVRQLCLQDVAG